MVARVTSGEANQSTCVVKGPCGSAAIDQTLVAIGEPVWTCSFGPHVAWASVRSRVRVWVRVLGLGS